MNFKIFYFRYFLLFLSAFLLSGLSIKTASACDIGVPVCTPAVSFYFPTNTTTTTDFTQWKLSLSDVTSTQEYRIDVEYQQFGTSLTTDDFNLIYPTYSIGIIPKTLPLLNPSETSTSWTATAYLLDSTSTDYFEGETNPSSVISSTTIEFTVVLTDSSTIETATPANLCGTAPAPFFAVTGSAPYFEVGNPIDTLRYGGCLVLTYGFIPSESQKTSLGNAFSSLWSMVSNKVPIGYFTLISGDLGAISTSTADATTTEIITSSSTTAFSAIFDPIDFGLITVLWLLFSFWLLNRMRKIEL